MSVCVFIGPTLPVADARRVLDAVYLPPARHGDVYRAAALLRPRAIGIVDGYFQWTPAVWHKEILWALSAGIHVFGAASMGALRAAELAAFGMRGVGRIFEAYRDAVFPGWENEPFEDDDEVCVVHGPAESGYLAASEAMVNIRCTLAQAMRAGVVGASTSMRLAAIAKSMFFPERDYRSLLKRARADALPAEELVALERWLPSGKVDQKRSDAVAMIEIMRDFMVTDPAPARVAFAFEHTTLWEQAVAALQPVAAGEWVEAAVMGELRLDPVRCESLRKEAIDSLIGTGAHTRELGGSDSEQCLERATQREVARRLQAQVPAALMESKLLALLRDTGAFATLRERAEHKRECLARLPLLPEVEDFSELQLLELRDWYFANVAAAEMPDDLDRWIHDHGYADLDQFHQAIFEEYVYREQTGGYAHVRSASGHG